MVLFGLGILTKEFHKMDISGICKIAYGDMVWNWYVLYRLKGGGVSF